MSLIEKCAGLRWLPLALAVLVLDQITKLMVIEAMALYDQINLAPFFNLVRLHNTGAAFSLFADQPGWQRGFFITLALVASVVIVRMLCTRAQHWTFYAALTLILGGAVGNVIDRVAYGYVVDFLDVFVGTWHWPAFNVADSGITVGAGLLIWHSLRADTSTSEKDAE